MDQETEPFRTPLASPDADDPDFKEGTHWLHFYIVNVPRTSQPCLVVIHEVVGFFQGEVISFNLPVGPMRAFLAELAQLPSTRVDNDGVSICLDYRDIPATPETPSASS